MPAAVALLVSQVRIGRCKEQHALQRFFSWTFSLCQSCTNHSRMRFTPLFSRQGPEPAPFTSNQAMKTLCFPLHNLSHRRRCDRRDFVSLFKAKTEFYGFVQPPVHES